MKLIKIILSVYVLSKLTACTSVQNTYSEVNDTTNFALYQSFAWIPNDTILPENILYENDIIQNKLTRTVNKELQSRGLQSQDQNIEADLLLKYTIIIKEKRQLINYPIYTYEPISNVPADYGQYLEPGIPNYPYNYSYNYYNPIGTYQYQQINTFNYPYLNYNIQNANAFRPVVSGSNFEEVQFDEGTIIIDAFDAYNGQLVWRGWSQGDFTNPIEFKDQLEVVIGYIFQRFPLDKTTMARNE
jgi:hypothetical protein